MKTIISIITGIAIFAAIVFLLDPIIINWFMGLVPDSDWDGVIRVFAWWFLLSCTLGVTIVFSALIGAWVYVVINGKF